MNNFRYMVFAVEGFYPKGGWEDFMCGAVGFDAAKDAAIENAKRLAGMGTESRAHVVDCETFRVVFRCVCEYGKVTIIEDLAGAAMASSSWDGKKGD